MGGRKKMSKIKESKGFRVFGRLVGRQESIAMLYVVIMMVPNVLLTITERYPFSVTLAALLLGCLLVAGYLPGSDKVSEAANGRLALWKVTILTYGKEGLLFQIFGMGPDSFYYALYQWGSDAMDWINRGLLDNNIYSNAHNEWLTLLVQQGILGVIAYGGIFLTAFRNLRISATRDPRALAVSLGLTGYLICSLFTFQHVLSTPFAFALLGMAEGVLCKDVLNKS